MTSISFRREILDTIDHAIDRVTKALAVEGFGEAWLARHYNAVRPHSSLDYLTPHEFKLHHPPIPDHPNRAISRNDRLEEADSGHSRPQS